MKTLALTALLLLSPSMAFAANCTSAPPPNFQSHDEITLGVGANAQGNGAIAIGTGANAINNPDQDGPGNIAIGNSASSTGGTGQTAVGTSAITTADDATAVGTFASATNCGATANGTGSEASGFNSTASGHYAKATGDQSTANGAGAQASGVNSTATGSFSTASGDNSTAIGANASATHNNSVALGAGSQTTRDNEVNVGNRQIGGVQDGVWDTDAVNVRQMRANDEWIMNQVDYRLGAMDGRLNRVGAMGMASAMMTGSAASIPGKNKVSMGFGNYNGQNAFAIGYQRAFVTKRNRPMALTLGASFSGSERSVGAGFAFGL